MRKAAAYLLVIAGILILLYPKASEWYNDKQQERLLASWEDQEWSDEEEESEVDDAAREQYSGLTNLFAEEPSESDLLYADDAPTSESTEQEPSATPKPIKLNPIATIKIPSIKLNLPVLEGATQQNMKYAAAHLKETAKIGQVGNAAIAAHRMRAKGKLFNRLNEVKEGDEIIIETKDGTYTYIVYATSLVEPTDVSVLNYNKVDKRLTLITCDPVVDPTHRLIVHAELK